MVNLCMERLCMLVNVKIVMVGFSFLGLLGCAGPVVKIEHRLPNAVELPKGVGTLRAGDFDVEGYSHEMAEKFVQDALTERLQKIAVRQEGNIYSGRVMTVGGTVRIDSKDAEGLRKVRLGNPTGQTEERELASLVRRIKVNCVFTIKEKGTLSEPILVELERQYDSAGDARTRGELGLNRGDDPASVVATDTIVRELIVQCVKDFCGMIEPVVVESTCLLRGSWNSEAIQGAQAAKHGDYSAAVRHYSKATQQEAKNSDLWFNLGVVTEVRGDLSEAQHCYEQVIQLSKDRDKQALSAAERIRKLRERIKEKK